MGTVGAFLGALGVGAIVMRWAPLVPSERMFLGALLIIPAFVLLHTAALFTSPRMAWLFCGTAFAIGLVGVFA